MEAASDSSTSDPDGRAKLLLSESTAATSRALAERVDAAAGEVHGESGGSSIVFAAVQASTESLRSTHDGLPNLSVSHAQLSDPPAHTDTVRSGGHPDGAADPWRVPHMTAAASSSSSFCGPMTKPMTKPTKVSAEVSLNTGARSSPRKVGSDGTASSADLASAALSLFGAKAAKSVSSVSRTNCQVQRILDYSYPTAHDSYR
jgi:hypothetical protein